MNVLQVLALLAAVVAFLMGVFGFDPVAAELLAIGSITLAIVGGTSHGVHAR